MDVLLMRETHRLEMKHEALQEAIRLHDAEMEAIAKRGGLTLQQMRDLSIQDKESFIAEHRREK
jgi:hypothetical protein